MPHATANPRLCVSMYVCVCLHVCMCCCRGWARALTAQFCLLSVPADAAAVSTLVVVVVCPKYRSPGFLRVATSSASRANRIENGNRGKGRGEGALPVAGGWGEGMCKCCKRETRPDTQQRRPKGSVLNHPSHSDGITQGQCHQM